MSTKKRVRGKTKADEKAPDERLRELGQAMWYHARQLASGVAREISGDVIMFGFLHEQELLGLMKSVGFPVLPGQTDKKREPGIKYNEDLSAEERQRRWEEVFWGNVVDWLAHEYEGAVRPDVILFAHRHPEKVLNLMNELAFSIVPRRPPSWP